VEVIDADEEEGPLSVEDLEPAEDETGDLAAVPPEGEVAPEGEEAEEVLPEEVAVTAEDLFEDQPDQVPVAGAPSAEAPEPEAVEAAAEHFASGIRESPEDVERELLADLGEGAPEVETVTITPPPPVTAPEEEAPTWQEAAEPVAEEPEAPVAGRNLPAALASGVLLALAVLALLLIGKAALAWFVGAVVLLGQAELYAVMRTRRLQPATLLGLVCGGLILAGAYAHGPAGAPFGLVLAMGLTVLWYMAAPAATRRSTTVHAGATLLGIAYVPFLASFALLLLAFPGNLGRNAFLVVVGLTVLYDVCAYAIGTLWGSRPLAPTISPHKSWEGAIGATFVLLLVALAVVPSIAPFDAPGRAVGLALVIALAAPLGDLVESALKRDMAVKDMGTLLPGHGGILDRIDAILFAAPAAYYFLQISF
jgi:phosphatidate cytidylyltransferase